MTHVITQEKYKSILEKLEKSKNYLGVIGSTIVPLEIIAKTNPKNILLFDANPEAIKFFEIYKKNILESNNNIEFIEKIFGLKSNEIEQLKDAYKNRLFLESKDDFNNYWNSLNLEKRFDGEKDSLNHRFYKSSKEILEGSYFSEGESFFNNETRFNNLKDSLNGDNVKTTIANITSEEFSKIINQYFRKGIFSNNSIDLISLSNIIPGDEENPKMYLNETSFDKVKENLKTLNTSKRCKLVYGLNPIYQNLNDLLVKDYKEI